MYTHEFLSDVKISLELDSNKKFDSYYKNAFPNLKEIAIEENLDLQKKGYDKIITLQNGKKIFVEEKVRYTKYKDILFEYISNSKTGATGWCEKDIYADFIAYIFVDKKIEFHLFPAQNFLRVWKDNKKFWLEKYGYKIARNVDYCSYFCCVPVMKVYHEIMLSFYIKGE